MKDDVVDADRKPVTVIECADADDLIQALHANARKAISLDRSPYQWAYRGQADARWRLVPTALRPGVTLGFYPERRQYVSKGYGASMEQMNAEVIAVRQFAELADRVGLPIPGLVPFYRQDGFDIGNYNVAAVAGQIGTADWPKPEMLELLAIAQHHGVPTRLIDFTYDPLVAIFFAADDIVRNRKSHEKNAVTELAVWGINLHELYKIGHSLGVVEVERARNPFLFAQRGLFVFDKGICDSGQDVIAVSLDERIVALCRREDLDAVIVKFTMPIDEAKRAVEILAIQGIDRAHLMPTYDNVVAHLKTLSRSYE